MLRRGSLYTGFCPRSGKRSYRNELDVLLENALNPRTIRAYRCQFCHSWHATSKPKREQAA